MNTGFFLFGLALLAGVLLLRGLPGGRRGVLIATAALLAAGGILVALFPGSGSGTSGLHGLGAAASFVAGNALVILVGRAHRLLGVSRRLGRALVGLGMFGFVSLAAFVAVLTSGTDVLTGLVERGVNYPFLIGFIVLGVTAPGDSRT
jgi:peptidoglycan/LPS O-acetylase OafA/YrhL